MAGVYRYGKCKYHLKEQAAIKSHEDARRILLVDDAPDCVYAIYAETPDPSVKFGVSQEPEKRLAALQTGSPARLTLYGSIPGSYTIEKAIHLMLADYRTHGEWFSFTGEAKKVADAIASQCLDAFEACFD